MKSFVIKRSGANFYKMIEIWNWCEATFGKADCFNTWDASFANGNENYAKFTFYDESLATLFVLRWNDYCVSRDHQFNVGILSWSEYSS